MKTLKTLKLLKEQLYFKGFSRTYALEVHNAAQTFELLRCLQAEYAGIMTDILYGNWEDTLNGLGANGMAEFLDRFETVFTDELFQKTDYITGCFRRGSMFFKLQFPEKKLILTAIDDPYQLRENSPIEYYQEEDLIIRYDPDMDACYTFNPVKKQWLPDASAHYRFASYDSWFRPITPPPEADKSYDDRITADRMEFLNLTEEEKKQDYRERRKQFEDQRQEQYKKVTQAMETPTAIITGYRFSATGVFGYVFYQKQEKLCSVSSIVVPSPPLTITGKSRIWKYSPTQSDCAHKICMSVRDELTGKEAFRLSQREDRSWLMEGTDEEFPADVRWEISDEDGKIMFYYHEAYEWLTKQKVAAIEKITEAEWIPEVLGMNVEPAFRVNIFDNNEEFEESVLAIVAFPMLRSSAISYCRQIEHD